MVLPHSTPVTPQEYLAMERRREDKSEYWDGEIFCMSGASRAHNLIVTNVSRELSTQLLERPCEVYPSDMRVRISHTARYVYTRQSDHRWLLSEANHQDRGLELASIGCQLALTEVYRKVIF